MWKIRSSIRRYARGDDGFTLLELLVVIAILGILAAVIIPNMGTFTKSGKLAAANTELMNVRTAESGYRAEHSAWAATSDNLSPYIEGKLTGFYRFDTADGWVTYATNWSGLTFDASAQAWKK